MDYMRKKNWGKQTSFLIIYFFMFFIFSALGFVEAREELRAFDLLDDVGLEGRTKKDKKDRKDIRTKALSSFYALKDTGAVDVKNSNFVALPSGGSPQCGTNYWISKHYKSELGSDLYFDTGIIPEEKKLGKIVFMVKAKITRDGQLLGDSLDGHSFFLGKISFSAKKAKKIPNNKNKNARQYMAKIRLPSDLFQKEDGVQLFIERINEGNFSNYSGVVYLKAATFVYNKRKKSEVTPDGYSPNCNYNGTFICGCDHHLCGITTCCLD